MKIKAIFLPGLYGSMAAEEKRVFPARQICDLNPFVPVSYTHLDVYKRQGQESLQAAACFLPAGNFPDAIAIGF